MDRNFKVRVAVGVGLFVAALVSLYTLRGVPFKVLYWLFSLVAALELFSFFSKKKITTLGMVLAVLELGFLVGGCIFAMKTDVHYFWYIILGVCGYDTFAYLFGKAIGGKIFKKSRPFSYVSKNKTWEGTIFGLLFSLLFVSVYMLTTGDTELYFLLCGPLALVGDLFESFLKRQFKIKDSNEILIKHKFFRELEYLVGGSEGHGGFLDRIDSIAFTATMLILLAYVF